MHRELPGLLFAIDALVETGDPEQAMTLLTRDDHLHPAAGLRALSATRIRRRLLSVDCPDLAGAVAQLDGALSEPGPAVPPPGTPRH